MPNIPYFIKSLICHSKFSFRNLHVFSQFMLSQLAKKIYIYQEIISNYLPLKRIFLFGRLRRAVTSLLSQRIVILLTKNQYLPKPLTAVTWNECWTYKIYPAVKSGFKATEHYPNDDDECFSIYHRRTCEGADSRDSSFHDPIIRENIKLSFIQPLFK